MAGLGISATNSLVTVIGSILVVAVLVGILTLVRWAVYRTTDVASDAILNASRHRTNEREGDNTDYVANKFRNVVLPPELRAAIAPVPCRPPQPGDRQSTAGIPDAGVSSYPAWTSPQAQPASAQPHSGQRPTNPQNPLQPRFCPRCGAQLNPAAQFCARCGSSVRSAPSPGEWR